MTDPLDCTETELRAHFDREEYEGFTLTRAVRPSLDLTIIPKEGYKETTFYDEYIDRSVPVLVAAVTAQKLADVFSALLRQIGTSVSVVLQTSHDRADASEDLKELARLEIDSVILQSTLYDYEELLWNDGCTGIAVFNAQEELEVQFDEHKLFTIYAIDLTPFRQILADYEIPYNPDLKLITDADHIHSSSDEFAKAFFELSERLGTTWDHR